MTIQGPGMFPGLPPSQLSTITSTSKTEKTESKTPTPSSTPPSAAGPAKEPFPLSPLPTVPAEQSPATKSLLTQAEKKASELSQKADEAETPSTAVDIGGKVQLGSAASSFLVGEAGSLVSDHATATNNLQFDANILGATGAGLELVGRIADISVQAVKLFDQNAVIQQARKDLNEKGTELTSLKEELESAKADGNSSKAEELEQKIAGVEKEISGLQVKVQKEVAKHTEQILKLSETSVKAALATTKEAGTYVGAFTQAGSEAAHVAAVTASVAGLVTSAVGIGLSSAALIENKDVSTRISQERTFVEGELEKARGSGDEMMVNVLELRLRNLDIQAEENNVGILKNSLSLTAGVLGSVGAGTGVATAVGCTVGAAVTTAVAATGVGAAVLGGAALATGIGYLGYKNRHAIQNQLQTGHNTYELWSTNREIKQLSSDSEAAQATQAIAESNMRTLVGLEPQKPTLDFSPGEIEVFEQLVDRGGLTPEQCMAVYEGMLPSEIETRSEGQQFLQESLADLLDSGAISQHGVNAILDRRFPETDTAPTPPASPPPGERVMEGKPRPLSESSPGVGTKKSHLEKMEEQIQSRIETLDQKLQDLQAKREAIASSKPDGLFDGLKQKLDLAMLDSDIESAQKEIRSVANKRTRLALSRARMMQTQTDRFNRSEDRRQDLMARTQAQTERRQALSKHRAELKKRYQYGKDIAKFGKSAEGKSMSPEELEEIHTSLYKQASSSPESMQRLSSYFEAQSARCGSEVVDVSSFESGAASDKFWNGMLAAVCAPV